MENLLKKYEARLNQMLQDNSWLTDQETYDLLVEIVNDLREAKNK